MLTRHARPTHVGRTEPLAEPSLMAFMAGCSSNGCSEPRVERWTRRGRAFWTFGSVHAGPQGLVVPRERQVAVPGSGSPWSVGQAKALKALSRSVGDEFPIAKGSNLI